MLAGCAAEVPLLAAPPPPPGDAGAAAPTPSTPLAYPASRCGECHNKMLEEWRGSAHARASESPVYQAMRRVAGEVSCDGCHAPLASRLPAADPVVAQGVTCEVCHNIKEIEIARTGSRFELHLEDRTKYGPLCDAEDHYFHRMGCSPLHSEGTFCAGCHIYYRSVRDGERLPVFTEYEEWRDGPLAAAGMECQSCHMPGAPAEVAVGAGERPSVSHHGLLGEAGDLRHRAAEVRARVRAAAGSLVIIEAEVRNVGAGHAIPTGLPARRLVLRATATATDGTTIAPVEHLFGRILVDDDGRVVPFFRATRLEADNRIPPRGRAAARLEIEAPESGELRIELLWRPLDPAVAAALELEPGPDVISLAGSVSLRPPRGEGRPGLPRTVTLER